LCNNRLLSIGVWGDTKVCCPSHIGHLYVDAVCLLIIEHVKLRVNTAYWRLDLSSKEFTRTWTQAFQDFQEFITEYNRQK